MWEGFNMLNREQMRKDFGNMGTYGNCGREHGNKYPPGRPSTKKNRRSYPAFDLSFWTNSLAMNAFKRPFSLTL